jgi:hypothetical protein
VSSKKTQKTEGPRNFPKRIGLPAAPSPQEGLAWKHSPVPTLNAPACFRRPYGRQGRGERLGRPAGGDVYKGQGVSPWKIAVKCSQP